MAPPPLKKEPSHFEVLSLTPTSLDGQDAPTQTKTVKQAYRRALLKHHPDKSQQAKAQDAPSDPSSSGKKKDNQQHYTVDQITQAYTVLSDPGQRREYVRSLQTQSHASFTSSSSGPGQKNGSSGSSSTSASQNYNYHKSFSFKATPQQAQAQAQASSGVETIDLDDIAWDGRKKVYHHTCSRCGMKRGYCFRELDLEEVGEDGELMVQCTGCSLWLRVVFEDADEDEEEDDEATGGSREVKQRANSQGEELRHTTSGSASGKSGGWSWKLNFGISIGGGASASASAGRR